MALAQAQLGLGPRSLLSIVSLSLSHLLFVVFCCLSLEYSPHPLRPCSFCHLAINFAPINTPCFWLRQICGTPLVNIDEAAAPDAFPAAPPLLSALAWLLWLAACSGFSSSACLLLLLLLCHSRVDGLLPKLCCSLCSAAAAVASFD